ncbi:hypothetical protein ABZ958_03350 [Streptomyces sp. NPDC046237]|uniref:hypothetical protein n=1 Tax=Streptomyces sp. NPDC046237 TaxID=3154914 RepID=UPI0033C0F644
MSRLPRVIADLIRFWRDLIRHPREVILVRAHHQWRGAGFIALVAVLVVAGVPGFPSAALLPAVLLGGPSWLIDLAGALAHGLWVKDRLWATVECPCCCGGPDDEDDGPDPNDPTDGGGLARDIEAWLRNQPTRTH